MKHPIPVLIAPLLLAACASQGPESRLGTQEKERQAQVLRLTRTSDCVFQSSISGFEFLDDRHVVLFASGSRHAYLAELSGACSGMRSQFSLTAVDGDSSGQVCGYGRDSIAYGHMGRVENCRIMGLERLTDERRLELGVGVPARPVKDEKDEKDGERG
jgi:hypothetical protein